MKFIAAFVLLCNILQIQADRVQLKGQNDGELPDSVIDDDDRMNNNNAMQRQDLPEEPFPNGPGIDGSKFAEMMSELKVFINQAKGEKYDDEEEDYDESRQSKLQQPANFNVEFLDDNSEEAVEQYSSSDYARKYDKQVIYIESYRRRGRWLDAAYDKGSGYFSQVPEENTVDTLGVKWRVKNVGGGAVVLESMLYRHHYLDAHHSHWCKVTYSSYPDNQSWAKFKIENRNGRYFFRSVRYSNLRLDEFESWWSNYYAALAEGTGTYAQFRIYIPPKKDYYETVATLDNSNGLSKRKFKYYEEEGISITNGREVSTTVASEIGLEIMEAFSFGLSFSTTWKTFQHTTYSRKRSITLETDVPPRKILYVKQLKGEYGHYLVQAKHFKFVEVNLQANTQRVVFARGMDEYNRGEFLPNPDGFGDPSTLLHASN